MISPQIQLDAIQRHCEQQGHTLIGTLEDIDLSGRFWKRRQVEHAIQRIEAGEAEVLVVWKTSRVSRNRTDWNIAVDRVEAVGGRIESATEPLDTTTSSGRFARGVLAELAVFESERIGESWKEAHAQRVKRGLPHHGRPRLGYTYTREKGYEVDPMTGPALRQMYLDYISGVPLTRITEQSAALGGPANIDGVRYMLDNGFASGKVRYRGELLPGAHEPLVSPEEFEAYQRARKRRSGRQRAEAADFSLSGLVRCWCGQTMWGNTRTLNGVDQSRYLCATSKASRTHTNSIAVRIIESEVLSWLESVAEGVNAKAGKAVKPPKVRSSRKQVEAAVSKNAARIDSLTLKWLDGEVEKEVHDRLMATLKKERATLEEKLAEEKAKEQAPKDVALVPDLLGHWDRMPSQVKREVLSKLLSKVTVQKAGAEGRVQFTPLWA